MHKNTVSAGEYFLQQQMLCRRLLPAYIHKKDAEGLHRLRVAIKKINALLIMLHKLQGHFNYEKNYAPYKKVFKQLAPIRQELLQTKKLKEDTQNKPLKNNPFRASTHKKPGLSPPRFLKAIEKSEPLILADLHNLPHKNIYPYCKNLSKKLKRKWNDIVDDDDLHKYRKHIKQLLYCSKLLTRKEKDKTLSEKGYKRIDKLQDLIGNWHDNILLLTKIEKEDLKVTAKFLLLLQNETGAFKGKIRKKGNKLA